MNVRLKPHAFTVITSSHKPHLINPKRAITTSHNLADKCFNGLEPAGTFAM